MRPIAIDFYCCEGGVSRGLANAGFDVLGVDLFSDYSQKRYPYPSHKVDALAALRTLIAGRTLQFSVPGTGSSRWVGLWDVVLLTASPPCQASTQGTVALDRSKYPRLIEPTRDLLLATGKPYIIENVINAPLVDPVELCGCMFDLHATDDDGIRLNLWRQRLFESNLDLPQPKPGALKLRGSTRAVHDEAFHAYEWVGGCYGGARRDKYEAKYVRKGGYVPANKAVVEAYMGIDWMTWGGLYQAIPPRYSEFLGREALALISDEGLS